jgi:hypothetical protein
MPLAPPQRRRPAIGTMCLVTIATTAVRPRTAASESSKAATARVRDRSISAASDRAAEVRNLSHVRRHHRNPADHLPAISVVAVRAELPGEDALSDIEHPGSATERQGIWRGDALGAGMIVATVSLWERILI